MKKITTVALALAVMLAGAAFAFAQGAPVTLSGDGSGVSPSKAGTKKKPANGSVQTNIAVNADARATLGNITYSTDSSVKVSGKGFPTCGDDVLTSDASKCPKKSKVGEGTATALLSGTGTQIDFTFDVYVGGPKKISLVLTTKTLPDFIAVFPGTISGSKISVDIPKSAQQPAPGLYAYLTSIKATLSAKPLKVKKGKGKKKKTTKYNFVSVTGCKGGKHTLGQKLTFVDQVDAAGTLVAPAPAPASTSTTSSCKK